ncbi:hypothetical protein JCM8547_002642 [Rhodosporidiobolus lusitaniae]
MLDRIPVELLQAILQSVDFETRLDTLKACSNARLPRRLVVTGGFPDEEYPVPGAERRHNQPSSSPGSAPPSLPQSYSDLQHLSVIWTLLAGENRLFTLPSHVTLTLSDVDLTYIFTANLFTFQNLPNLRAVALTPTPSCLLPLSHLFDDTLLAQLDMLQLPVSSSFPGPVDADTPTCILHTLLTRRVAHAQLLASARPHHLILYNVPSPLDVPHSPQRVRYLRQALLPVIAHLSVPLPLRTLWLPSFLSPKPSHRVGTGPRDTLLSLCASRGVEVHWFDVKDVYEPSLCAGELEEVRGVFWKWAKERRRNQLWI